MNFIKINLIDKNYLTEHIWIFNDEYFWINGIKYEIESFNNDKWVIKNHEEKLKIYICIWARLAVLDENVYTIKSVM